MVDKRDKDKDKSPLMEKKIGRREAIKRIARGVAVAGTFAATTAFFQNECITITPYYNYSRGYSKYNNYANYRRAPYYNYSKYSRAPYYNYSRFVPPPTPYKRSYYNYIRYYLFIFDV